VTEATVRGAVTGGLAAINTTLLTAARTQIQQIPTLDFDRDATATVADIDTPIVGTTMIGGIPIPVRNINLLAMLGLPRNP
jgi:hypothetical protein